MSSILFKFQWHIELLLVDARLGLGLNSTSALNKIKGLYNHGSNHIVMVVTTKDSVWKSFVWIRF